MAKVLWVCNEDGILLKLQKILAQIDAEVIIADSIRRANRLLESDPCIDLIIVDENWPGNEHHVFLSTMKGMPRFVYIPILLTSSSLEENDIVKYYQFGVRDFIILPASAPTISMKIQKALEDGKPTALIVDDDEIILDLLANILELERFRVLKASNGKEALAVLDEAKVDVVVSDILMPEMTGLELLGEVKCRFEHLPVIMITGFSGDYTANDVLAAGADGYFSKPFKNTELIR